MEPTPQSTIDAEAKKETIRKYKAMLIEALPRSPYFNSRMNIPRRFHGKAIDSFDMSFPEVVGLEKTVKSYLFDFLDNGKSLFLTGKCGSGKTALAVAFLYEKARRMVAGIDIDIIDKEFLLKDPIVPFPSFLEAGEFLMKLKETYGNEDSEYGLLQNYGDRPLLLLDDLGANQETDWARSRFYYLINRVYNDGRQIVVTSNSSLKEISERIDDRIASRLCEMGNVLDLGGKDYRLREKEN